MYSLGGFCAKMLRRHIAVSINLYIFHDRKCQKLR